MTKVINEIGLYFGLYFKRIFSIKNILFSITFSFLIMMLFMSFTLLTLGWGDMFCLINPLIISVSVIFAYTNLGKDKFHKKDKEYLLINLIFFILFSFLLSVIVFGMVLLTDYIYNFNNDGVESSIYNYSYKILVYENLLLTLTMFFICSIINKLIAKEKNQILVFMSLALMIFVGVMIFGFKGESGYSMFRVHGDGQYIGQIQFSNNSKTNSLLGLIGPGNSFIGMFRVLFYHTRATNMFQISNFQGSNSGGYVGISQYVGLSILSGVNIVMFEYKEKRVK